MPEPGPDRPSLPPLREVIARHGLGARRALGQNFLLDLNLTRRIARAAGPLAGEAVLEVGPGPGGLTRALLEAEAAQVVALERDRRCLAALDELAEAFPGRLRVVGGDALDVDEQTLVPQGAVVVSNLPYNVATPLLFKWLDHVAWFRDFTLMFQKEVAERLAARPGTKAYGRLAVMTQWRCEVRALFDVPARAFVPPPKVTSTLVGLYPRAEPLAPADPRALERVVAAAFGQRRKMLRSSLKTLGTDPAALLEEAGLVGDQRAEDIPIDRFCALARAYAQKRGQTPFF